MEALSRIPPRRAPGSRTLHAFENRSYRLLWPANFFSYTCRWTQLVLLSWLVLELTDSPWLVALVGFVHWTPVLVLGMVGGVLADRLDRRRLLVATQSANLVAAVAMTVLLVTGLAQYWHSYLVILVSGTAWALDTPSRRALIYDFVGRRWMTNALALDSVGSQASKLLGPALAGALITVADVEGGYAAVALFYLVALRLVWSLRLPPRRTEARVPFRMLRNLSEGFRYARGHSTIMGIILVTMVMNVLLFPYVQMVPVIARDVLHVGPGLMGVLISADGLGALIGAVLVASAGNISYHGRLFLGGAMVALVGLLLFSLSPWYLGSLPALLMLGLGAAGFGTMQSTIVLLVAREEMQGRALGMVSFAIGASPVGFLMVGAVADTVSPNFAIGLNAALGVVFMVLIGLLMPSLRRRTLPEEQPSPASG